MIFYITILFSFIFSQLKPYEEPIFLSDYSKDYQYNYIELENNKFTLPIEKGIHHHLLKLNTTDLYEVYINAKFLSSNFKIYFINIDDYSFTGPYTKNDIINDSIKCNPIKAQNILIELNFNSDTYERIDCFLQKHENINITSKRQYYKSRNNPTILVTGYWPPTNEMIRHFSQDISLNPNGWEGDNWESRGYDIVSYFPTFDDPNCSNCGQGNGMLQVDYQNTSNDYWPIVEEHKPIAIITFSRGYIDQSWELENNYYNRTNWYNDYNSPYLPTPNPPDSNEDSFYLRNSNLPMNEIIQNVGNLDLGLNPYIDIDGDPGHFVSEFMGYHGVWYRDLNSIGDFKCLSAGHIHVGGQIINETAKSATNETIRTLINHLDQFIYTPGDANLDEVIDVLDLVVIMNYVLGNTNLSEIALYASDINEDSIINIQDIILVINIILSN